MFETLAGYLEACASPEQRRVCLDACNALVEAGIDDHAFVIDQQLAMADGLDGDAVVAIVWGTLIPLYANQLSDFGVTLTEEATLANYVDVFTALMSIDNWDDPETLQGFCESPEGSQTALADILAVVGREQLAEEYLPILAYVSPSLLERISQVCTRENIDEVPDVKLTERARERLLKLFATATAQAVPELLVHKALEDGARLGTPVQLLIAPYQSVLDNFGPNQLGVELLGFVCASNVKDVSLLSEVQKQLEHFNTLDTHKVMTINVLVEKLIKQVTNA